jgi:hypothetical protein
VEPERWRRTLILIVEHERWRKRSRTGIRTRNRIIIVKQADCRNDCRNLTCNISVDESRKRDPLRVGDIGVLTSHKAPPWKHVDHPCQDATSPFYGRYADGDSNSDWKPVDHPLVRTQRHLLKASETSPCSISLYDAEPPSILPPP